MRRHTLPLLLAALAAGCTPSDGAQTEAPSQDTTAAAPSTPAPGSPSAGGAGAAVSPWRSNPSEGVSLTAGTAGEFTLQTRPHVIAWAADGAELAPPYSVRATLEKTSGRIHEGVGLLFGGTGLEGPETGQRYAYFLIRGDGSYLIKQRRGAQTPVVRDWTTHAAIRRDTDGVGRPNELRVDVGAEETVFRINGVDVARVPTAELSAQGRAGVRASHDVQLRVAGFAAGAETAAP